MDFRPHPTNPDYVSFGDVARGALSNQCQYISQYVYANRPDTSEDPPKKGFPSPRPNLGKGLRFIGNTFNYHGMYIHKDDVETFVERYKTYHKRNE